MGDGTGFLQGYPGLVQMGQGPTHPRIQRRQAVQADLKLGKIIPILLQGCPYSPPRLQCGAAILVASGATLIHQHQAGIRH